MRSRNKLQDYWKDPNPDGQKWLIISMDAMIRLSSRLVGINWK